MVLPSLADILLVVVLLVPGFITIILFKKIAMREKKLTDFETTVWSLSASLAVYAVFGYITGLDDIDLIRENIFMPVNITLLFGLAIAFGGCFGAISRVLSRRGYRSGDCWEACFKSAAAEGSYVLVYTADGKEYMGELCFAGVSESSKEITLRNPTVVLRDSEGCVLGDFEIGKNILFKENDVRRVVFLKDIA